MTEVRPHGFPVPYINLSIWVFYGEQGPEFRGIVQVNRQRTDITMTHKGIEDQQRKAIVDEALWQLKDMLKREEADA